MSLASDCLLEIQTVFPAADARIHDGQAQIFVPVPNREIAPLVLGAGPDFDAAGVYAVACLGDMNPEFGKRSKIYQNWTD